MVANYSRDTAATQPRYRRDTAAIQPRFRTFTSSSDDPYSPVGLLFSYQLRSADQPAALRDLELPHLRRVLEGDLGDDPSLKIESLEAAKIMKIRLLVLDCSKANFPK